MEGKYTGKRLVHSDAEIEARVWYTAKKKEGFVQEEKKLTGNSEKRYSINVNNFKINLYKSIPKFEKYDTINESKTLKLFSNFYLPIQLETCEYKESVVEQRNYGYEELKNKIIEDLNRQLQKEVGENSNIVNVQINENGTDNELEIEMIYEVLEKIGISQRIEEENLINTEEITQ